MMRGSTGRQFEKFKQVEWEGGGEKLVDAEEFFWLFTSIFFKGSSLGGLSIRSILNSIPLLFITFK